MQTDYNAQAEAFLTRFGINFRATLKDSKPAPWGDYLAGHHYRVTLSKAAEYGTQRYPSGDVVAGDKIRSSKRLVFDFWGSLADFKAKTRTITPYDVLACISGDVNCPETFKDFCDEYGYGQDSIKALQTFRRCSSFGKRLREFFTAEEIEALQEIQ